MKFNKQTILQYFIAENTKFVNYSIFSFSLLISIEK